MKITDVKIGFRLGALAAFLLTAMIVVGLGGWYSLSLTNANNVKAMATAEALTVSINTARTAQVEFKKQVQEWKDLLLRGQDPSAFEKYRQGFVARSAVTQDNLRKLADQFSKLGLETPLVHDALKTHEELGVKYQDALKQYNSTNPDSAHVVDTLVKGIDRPPTKQIDDIVAFALAQSDRLTKEAHAAAAAHYQTACIFLLAAVISALCLGSIVTYWLVRSITVPLNTAVKIAQTVATGDLTRSIEVKSKDETGQLLQALKDMNRSLQNIVGKVRGDADTIAAATSQIASSNLDLSSCTEQQAGSLEKTASTMVELTSTVKQNGEHARQANQLAISASDVAVKGGEVVSQVVNTMGSINDSAKKIADIIGVIDGIAFQTNILALNAAVEAARAGEQGRGFAVVATEVRNLAQRSASAAKEIKSLITDSVEKVEVGSKLVNQAGMTMDEIVASVKRVTDIISKITAAGQEQEAGIGEINQAIIEMDNVTRKNVALAEETATATHSLQRQAIGLAQAASVFKLDISLIELTYDDTGNALHKLQ